MQKTIFEQDEIEQKVKLKKVVKKKKKKVNNVKPIQIQQQGSSLSEMMNKIAITPKPSNQTDIKEYSVGNKTYQEMIKEAKKPRRMPPQIQTQIQKNQEVLSSSEQEGQPQLIFFKPGVNIINNKNKKKKVLFELEKQGQQQQYQNQEQGQVVFNKLKHYNMKSQLQDLRAREMQTRHKTKEQLMIEFLKRKYNKNGEYSEQQLQLANNFVQSQYPLFSNQYLPQSTFQTPQSFYLPQYPQYPQHHQNTQNLSPLQSQFPPQYSPQEQFQSPSNSPYASNSQYPHPNASQSPFPYAQSPSQYSQNYANKYPANYPSSSYPQNSTQYSNQYPSQQYFQS